MASAGRKRGKKVWVLLSGLLLVAAGIAFFLTPSASGVLTWLVRLWPVYLVCAGVVRVMGFAIERRPRSPVGGMLLIFVGVLFFAARFHGDLNALQIYGRYWPALLAVFGAVELLRFYSHRPAEGAPPRLFTFWRALALLFIIVTGVVANRVAARHPSALSALKLPGVLNELRDSVVGHAYAFTDPAVVADALQPGARIVINNSYGDVQVVAGGPALRATLTKNVRAWEEEDARAIADQIRLVVRPTAEGVTVTTNRDEVARQFTTDIRLEVPADITLAVTNSYGAVSAEGVRGDVDIRTSRERATVRRVAGDVSLALVSSDAQVIEVQGRVSITGARAVKVSRAGGAVTVHANRGSVELSDVAGPVRVEAPFSRVVATGLGGRADIIAEHAGDIRVTRAAAVTVDASHADVTAEDIAGDLRVTSSQGKIRVSRVEGGLMVSASRGSVNASDVRGPVAVETSHGEVQVKNFYQGARVETSYRDVTLLPAGEPTADIEVENSHGEIKLTLPASSRFQLDAFSDGGQVRASGFAGLAERGENLMGVVGGAGPKVRLRTSYKKIYIRGNGARPAQDDEKRKE